MPNVSFPGRGLLNTSQCTLHGGAARGRGNVSALGFCLPPAPYRHGAFHRCQCQTISSETPTPRPYDWELKALDLKKINFIFSRLKKIEPAINFLLRKRFFWCSHHNVWKGGLVPEILPMHLWTRSTRDQPFTKSYSCHSLDIHSYHTWRRADIPRKEDGSPCRGKCYDVGKTKIHLHKINTILW